MCRMVACGLGVGVLPRSAARLYALALNLATVGLVRAEVERRLLLVMRRRSSRHA